MMGTRNALRGVTLRGGRALFCLLAFGAVIAITVPTAAGVTRQAFKDTRHTKTFWSAAGLRSGTLRQGVKPAFSFRATKQVRSFTLSRGSLHKVLAAAPRERTKAAKQHPLVVSLPAPNGRFQRFALVQSSIMAPGLAAKHPEITTYSGWGIDDRGATIHADLSQIGFHASIRSAKGAWYIDPYFRNSQSRYVSYFGQNLKNTDGEFVERESSSAELSVDEGYYHAADTVTVRGSGFGANTSVSITISDPEENFASRTVEAIADDEGSFSSSFVADADGNLETHIVSATDGDSSAQTSYQVVRSDDPTSDPPTGDVLRTYRLALITDPGYAAFNGIGNVTAAKVALINRVSQVYEDDLSIKLQLIANDDLLNLNTWDAATAPNGPCGAAPCFAQSNVTGCSNLGRNRIVIGQIIGASNYDIGHLALGQPGGGVANLGVVGRAAKAQGCTGIPTPTGDFYAIDYVAHEMGHQFSGNHPFNGNQLNCSGGNRNAATSVEPGSGSSIMAYAGICLTDDLQPHSDPYFSERSLQEISTYTSGNQAAINEVQEVALRHFGGGNEVQVATFGPGYAQASTIQPLTVAIGAAPSSTQLGGLTEDGNTVTVSTGAAGATHTLQPGDVVAISGAGNAGYNGTWTVATVPSSRSFTYLNPTAGLPRTGGGTITLAAPGLTESGNTVTVRTAAAHNRSVGDTVVITGANNASYNGTFTVLSVPSPRSFTVTNPTAGLPNAGAGTVTYSSPFQLRINGNDSPVIGGTGPAYNTANLQAAINATPGVVAGTITASGAAATGFTLTWGGALANTNVPGVQIVNVSCGGCFASVEETNHGGTNDSFTLTYNGNTSVPIVNGTNYTQAGLTAALAPILPAGTVVTLQAFGGGNISGLNNQGFAVSFGGSQAATNVPFLLQVTDPTAGTSGFVNELDKGGAVDNKGGIITPTGDSIPVVTAPASFTIPLRTPFALTGSATDADGDPLLYSWEQNDRGGAAGTALVSNTKTNGPLFAMFPKSGIISETDTLLYNSPGENHLTTSPTRVLPDLQQIIDNNTNANTGACPTGPIAPPVSIPVKECFSEFLPTSDYVGFAGTNASPLSLHWRFTARDPKGGVNSADTTLLLANTTGPFLVTAPNTAVTWPAGSTRTVSWDVAGTNGPPVNTTDVKISLSLDGGHTYPIVLASSTPNDGSESVVVPNVATTHARLKVEAVGNIYFDLSDADFTVTLPGVIGLDSLTASGKNVVVDSYDSAAGPYGTANHGSAADLFSNGGIGLNSVSIFGNVRSALGSVLVNKAFVSGDVRAGGPITNTGGTIGGTATPNSPSPTIVAPPVPACSPFSGTGGLSGKYEYNAATGDLQVSGGKAATLAPGTYCFHNLALSGGATLTVSGPVVIKLTGQLNGSGGSLVNLTKLPSNLQVESSYAGANGVVLSGGASGYLSVYAPQTSITISGSSPVFGALLGKTLDLSGNAVVHYDTQLVTVWAGHFNP
jgi:hypothetical protein